MTNDGMTNGMTNDRMCKPGEGGRQSFGIRHLVMFFVIPSFVIRHSLGADLTAAQLQFFENRIRPVLTENCYKCHSQGAEKVKGGLLLDSREGLLKGGNTGPAIVPGDPERSLLIRAI